MTEKTKLCGFQPTGDASQIPKPLKINRDSLSEEGRVSMPMEEFDKLEKLALSAHTDKLSVEKLQERCDRYEKALTEISKTKVPFRNGCFHWEDFSEDALKAQKALAAIGDEGSGDE